jgi:hypothetical protein
MRRTSIDPHAAFKRWLSPSIFALAALAFLLPFATVSCDQAQTTFSGVQLVTRTVPHGGTVDVPECTDRFEGGDPVTLGGCVEATASTAATVALVAVVLGFILGAFGIARGPGWCALVSLGAMWYVKGVTVLDDVNYRAGSNVLLGLLICAGVLHGYRALTRWQAKKRARKEAIGRDVSAKGPPYRASSEASS